MKITHVILTLFASMLVVSCGNGKQATITEEPALKDVFGDKFLVGVAVNVRQSSEVDTASVKSSKALQFDCGRRLHEECQYPSRRRPLQLRAS